LLTGEVRFEAAFRETGTPSLFAPPEMPMRGDDQQMEV